MDIPHEESVAERRAILLLPHTAQQDHGRGGENGSTASDERHQQQRQE